MAFSFAALLASGALGGVSVLCWSAGEARAENWPEVQVSGATDYDEARKLLAQGKWPEAAIVFRSVLRREPDHAEAAMGLARALAFSGRREEALSFLWRLADREKGNRRKTVIRRARVLSRLFLTSATLQSFQDGMNLLSARKYRSARERFERAFEKEPDNVEVLTRIGQCLVLENDFDSAAERLRAARRLNPYEPEVRLWLGHTMHQRGEIREAMEELKAAYAEMEGSEIAPLWYAGAAFSLGQRAFAVQLLEQQTKRFPDQLDALVHLARFRSQIAGRDKQVLWDARKDLQLALSRLDEYGTGTRQHFEGELSLDLRRTPQELRAEIQKLLQQIEGRLDQPSTQS